MLPSASEHTPTGWPKLCPVRTPRESRGWWALPNSCTSPNSSLTTKPPSGPGPTQKRHGGWSKGLPGWSEHEAVHMSRQVACHQEVAKSIHSQPLGGRNVPTVTQQPWGSREVYWRAYTAPWMRSLIITSPAAVTATSSGTKAPILGMRQGS